jgi:5-methylcytosine-specific restriction protein A
MPELINTQAPIGQIVSSLKLSSDKKIKNRNWNRDELILTLDLYFELGGHGETNSNPQVIQLSELLNTLSASESKSQTFRNPNGVALKLANFMSLDDTRSGGMQAVSKLDRQIFAEYKNDRQTLKRLSDKIKTTIKSKFDPAIIPDVDEDCNVKEGKRIQKIHFVKERNKSIVDKKKRSVLKQFGKLDCECCGFNFTSAYGDLGNDFIECHHIVPLSKLSIESTTELKDLALVCSNCHRMVHRIENCDIELLKEHINNQCQAVTQTKDNS